MRKLFCVVVGLHLFASHSYALTKSHPAIHSSSNFNVYLTIQSTTKTGEEFFGLCNGSLIADDLVITAAHCVSESMDHQDGVKVHVGKYKTLTAKKTGQTFTNYHSQIDLIQSKRIFLPSKIKSKAESKKLRIVNGHYDVALIQLERPVDRTKIDVQPINIVNRKEQAQIKANPSKYSFTVVSTNFIAEMSTQSKRYAPMTGIKFNSLTNKIYSIPMLNGTSGSEVEEGDSGSPVLVGINGEWKLFAVVKGVKRDFASQNLDILKNKKILEAEINITPKVNMYAPVADRICDLLTQANLQCL